MLQAALFLAGLAAPGGTPPPLEHLTILIVDFVPVAPDTLKNAISLSREIFLQARIETTWALCRRKSGQWSGTWCHGAPAAVVHLSIVPHCLDKQGEERVYGRTITNETLGGLTIAIFYEPIEVASRTKFGMHPSVLLGMAMTHEIGHFFGLNHGVLGVMTSRFGREDVMRGAAGLMRFEGQEKALRRAIARWK